MGAQIRMTKINIFPNMQIILNIFLLLQENKTMDSKRGVWIIIGTILFLFALWIYIGLNIVPYIPDEGGDYHYEFSRFVCILMCALAVFFLYIFSKVERYINLCSLAEEYKKSGDLECRAKERYKDKSNEEMHEMVAGGGLRFYERNTVYMDEVEIKRRKRIRMRNNFTKNIYVWITIAVLSFSIGYLWQ